MKDKNCSACTPEDFLDRTQLDIFDIFKDMKEGEDKYFNCSKCGDVKVSKINDKLKIEKIEIGVPVSVPVLNATIQAELDGRP